MGSTTPIPYKYPLCHMGLMDLGSMKTEEYRRIYHLKGRKVIKNKFTSRRSRDDSECNVMVVNSIVL